MPLVSDSARALAAALRELEKRKRERKLDFYRPYAKQREFHDLGATKRERMLRAGNQVGKTICAAAETAMHMTGLYPKWWAGRRWDRPTHGWICGKTGLDVRDNNQRLLFGTPLIVADRGSGMVPKDSVDWEKGISLAHGYAGLYDTVQVKHVSGGFSSCASKTYEQGREKWQGRTLDWVWLDEEGPMDMYVEALARISVNDGMVYTTFTPKLGKTMLVRRFQDEESPDRAMVKMSLYDAEHYTPEVRDKIIAGYPAWERDARVWGLPELGSGRVFDIDPETITETAMPARPPHWPLLWGIDFGGADHPFGAVLIAWDRDSDSVHVLNTVRMKGDVVHHADAMKAIAPDVPVAWPHDGAAADRGSGTPVAMLYKSKGLKMLPSHAAFPDGSISTEAGIAAMEDRMKTGRLKVARHLALWFEEFREYHREEGKIVKEGDDLMSATRIAVMALRNARVSEAGRAALGLANKTQMARDIDFDLFAS